MKQDEIPYNFPFGHYPIEIRQIQDTFHLICTKFNIVEQAKSLDTAYANLQTARITALKKLQEAGITEPFNMHPAATAATSKSMLAKFLSKGTLNFLIITTLLAVIAYQSVLIITNRLIAKVANVEVVAKNKIKNMLDDSGSIVDVLNNTAATMERVTPEKRAQIGLALRKIVTAAKPITDELKPLYQD